MALLPAQEGHSSIGNEAAEASETGGSIGNKEFLSTSLTLASMPARS